MKLHWDHIGKPNHPACTLFIPLRPTTHCRCGTGAPPRQKDKAIKHKISKTQSCNFDLAWQSRKRLSMNRANTEKADTTEILSATAAAPTPSTLTAPREQKQATKTPLAAATRNYKHRDAGQPKKKTEGRKEATPKTKESTQPQEERQRTPTACSDATTTQNQETQQHRQQPHPIKTPSKKRQTPHYPKKETSQLDKERKKKFRARFEQESGGGLRHGCRKEGKNLAPSVFKSVSCHCRPPLNTVTGQGLNKRNTTP